MTGLQMDPNPAADGSYTVRDSNGRGVGLIVSIPMTVVFESPNYVWLSRDIEHPELHGYHNRSGQPRPSRASEGLFDWIEDGWGSPEEALADWQAHLGAPDTAD